MLNKKHCVTFLKKILSTTISKLIELDEMKKNEIVEENEIIEENAYNKLTRELETLNKLLSATEEYIKCIEN